MLADLFLLVGSLALIAFVVVGVALHFLRSAPPPPEKMFEEQRHYWERRPYDPVDSSIETAAMLKYPPKGTPCREWVSNKPYIWPGFEAVAARARKDCVPFDKALDRLIEEQWRKGR